MRSSYFIGAVRAYREGKEGKNEKPLRNENRRTETGRFMCFLAACFVDDGL
jgi:hypothetical protein